MMTPRERLLAVLERRPVDRLPVDLWHTPEVTAALRRHFGVEDDFAMWRALGLDKIVWDFMEYPTVGARTAWGVPLRDVQAGEALYAEFGAGPLAGVTRTADIDAYPLWPRVDRFDYDGAVALARRASAEFLVIGPWVSLFEIYSQLRGLEQSFMDLAEAPSLVDEILDRVEAIQTAMMREFFRRAAGHLDLVFISDDLGSQRSLLMSPRSWARHLQPRLKRWCDLVHDHGLRVFYHSDGAVRPLIGPILDCGVDVLNPIQHACPGMDRAELKREFGSRVIFHGGVDNQSVLPRGTPDDVRREVAECLRTLGAGNEGYICCSCHNTQAGTPIENVLAMVEAVRLTSVPADREGRDAAALPEAELQ